MRRVCIVKTRKKYIYYYLYDYYCTSLNNNDATTTKQQRNDGHRSARQTNSTLRCRVDACICVDVDGRQGGGRQEGEMGE
jgi:hypothetical protein